MHEGIHDLVFLTTDLPSPITGDSDCPLTLQFSMLKNDAENYCHKFFDCDITVVESDISIQPTHSLNSKVGIL